MYKPIVKVASQEELKILYPRKEKTKVHNLKLIENNKRFNKTKKLAKIKTIKKIDRPINDALFAKDGALNDETN